ncbi:MAG: polysaccharide biosynthesis tyrosine autokinase [Bacteroidales bacterium]|nr:polysaccharide biosynthesis tyrosine autokinase [Bacteroidales bacterium]
MAKASEEIFQQKTDFKEIIFRVLRYKYYFVFTLFLALIIAFFINKYSDRKYANATTILIREESRSSFLGSDEMMSGVDLFGGISNVENELAVLKSFTVINHAIQELNLEVSYVKEENMFPFDFLPFNSYTELYSNSPIHVIIDQTLDQPVNVRFFIDVISDTTFRLTCSAAEVPLYNYVTNKPAGYIDSLNIFGIYKFGEKISGKHYNFVVHLNENYNPREYSNARLIFYFNNLYSLTGSFKGRLSIATTSTTSSVVNISLTGSHPKQITDFLNTLTRVYLDKNLEKKNKIAFNTVQFIDSRIADIADSLMFAENKLQNFRTSNQVMNLSFQGQKLYEKRNALENEKVIITVRQQYYDYINDYFERNSDVADLVAPSAMEVQDPVLNELIGELLDLNNQRMNYLQDDNTKNLFLRDLEIQISNVKSTILENIDYNYNRIVIQLQDIDSRMAKLNSQISRLPRTERELIGMERQFKLNDAIYTYLLQKRAEAQIARASNAPDYEIVDEALYFKAGIISPKTKMNYIIAAFLGLLLPFIYILIRDFLNNKISDIKDIEHISSLPIIGQVLHNKSKATTIIKDYPKSPIADSFRGIRTNLRFFAKGRDKMVILITSSMSGEGKSFSSINIASVYALLGKKTLLLGFDLRRPALYKDFKLKNEKGITSFLINNASIKQIIQPTQIENLDLIAAGPIPPNPVELIASDRTKEFFDELKEIYDYIVIDSAPIGAVSDSYLLFSYADINIFAVRHNISLKDAVKNNLKNIELKKIGNVSILINDIRMKKNSYGYAYQSNYYSDNGKSGFIKRMFGKKKST